MAQQQNPRQTSSALVVKRSNPETDGEWKTTSIHSPFSTNPGNQASRERWRVLQIVISLVRLYFDSFVRLARGDVGDRSLLHKTLTTACIIIMLLVFLIIPVSMLIVGSVYFDDCPANHMIPVYLVVGGAMSLLLRIYNVAQRCRRNEDDPYELERSGGPLDVVVMTFLLFWFIAGCYFTYSTIDKYQSDDPGKSDYCNRVLFLFTFWLLLWHFIVAFLYVVGTIVATIVLSFMRK